MRDDETTIKGNFATVTVRNDHGPNPECNRGQLYLALEGGNFTGLDANELRDAIDKAVGPREEEADWRDDDRVEVDWLGGRIVVGRETVGIHAGQWVFPSGAARGDDAVANLNPKAVSASTAKPYRPADRDRLLRHISDIEATLTRRNERHEEDQERIRELEGIAMRRGDRIDELEAKLEAEAAAPSPEEQIEARRKEYEDKGLADWRDRAADGRGRMSAEDVVNHPAHYTAYPVEVIELTEHMNYCRGNVVKYVARAGLKSPDTELEDLRKAQWYIEREIARLEGPEDPESPLLPGSVKVGPQTTINIATGQPWEADA